MKYYYRVEVPFRGQYAIGASRLEAARAVFECAFSGDKSAKAHARFFLQIIPEGGETIPAGSIVEIPSETR